jgi:ABC-type transport system substrate-binding protein
VLHLSAPYAPLLTSLSELWMVSPRSPGWDNAITRPAGTGPFQFGQWVPNVRLTAPANPRWWRAGQPHLEAVQFDLRGDVDKGLALRAGDLIFMGTPAGVAGLQPGDVCEGRLDELLRLDCRIAPPLAGL